MLDRLREHIAEHQRAVDALATDEALQQRLCAAARLTATALAAGGKVMLCGNGGSAADAQHFAAELTVRLERERKPLAAIALSTDTSAMTACANDYDYSQVFARSVAALGRQGDVLIALSTSGNSPNVLKAARAARELGIAVVAFTSSAGGAIADTCDLLINVPATRTMRVQELHEILLHAWCDLTEEALFGE